MPPPRPPEPASERPLLLGCGILARETRRLVEANRWPVDLRFLDSTLHARPVELHARLSAALERTRGQPRVVVYGECHPGMDALLCAAGACRVARQNCIEMLLGPERFREELVGGAFFLLEEWARRWDEVTTLSFGPYPHVVREIFQCEHRCLLALRTPCSGDFGDAARRVAAQVGLPLRWEDVGLEALEAALREALGRSGGAVPCPS